MSTLNVTSIQNPAAPQANLSLNADGTVTLPVFTGPSAPLLFQAGTLWFDTAGPTLLVRNPGNTAWVSAGGGGGGTVTGVTATAPLVSSGGAAPNLTINAATTGALGAVQIGTNVDVTTGTISIKNASATDKGVIEIATLAEAATGTNATLALTPSTGVPKDAATMTGAAILPSGTTAQQPGTPVVGMIRVNTDNTPDSVEAYDAASLQWRQLAYVPLPGTLPANLTFSASQSISGYFYCNNLTVNSGVVLTATSQDVVFVCTGDVSIQGSIIADGTGPTGGGTASSDGTNPATETAGPFRGQGVGASFGTPSAVYTAISSTLGSGGPGGFSTASGVATITSGAGGSSGGTVIIKAFGNITMAGIISANGGAATGGSGNIGSDWAYTGASGGSGGAIIFNAAGSLTVSGTLRANGGAGGSAQAAGIYIANNTWGGGGGGGGGYIILESLDLDTTGSTIQVNGAIGGNGDGTIGQPTLTGGSGASFGGQGGAGGSNGASAGGLVGATGATGIVAFYGSPI